MDRKPVTRPLCITGRCRQLWTRGFHGIFHASCFLDGCNIGSHHFSDRSSIGVPSADHHADQKIPFAEKSLEFTVLDDQNRADTQFGHAVRHLGGRHVRLNRIEVSLSENIHHP